MKRNTSLLVLILNLSFMISSPVFSLVKKAGYSFDRLAAELQRDDIYIFKKMISNN